MKESSPWTASTMCNCRHPSPNTLALTHDRKTAEAAADSASERRNAHTAVQSQLCPVSHSITTPWPYYTLTSPLLLTNKKTFFDTTHPCQVPIIVNNAHLLFTSMKTFYDTTQISCKCWYYCTLTFTSHTDERTFLNPWLCGRGGNSLEKTYGDIFLFLIHTYPKYTTTKGGVRKKK